MFKLVDYTLHKFLAENLGILEGDLLFAPTDLAIRKRKEKKGAYELPFASYWRVSTERTESLDNHPLASRGIGYRYVDEEAKDTEKKIELVPVTFGYHLDFWGMVWTQMDEIDRKWFFLQHKSPLLNVTIETVDSEKFDVDLFTFFEKMDDTSDLPSEYEKGKFFRHTYIFNVFAYAMNLKLSPLILRVIEDFYFRYSIGEYKEGEEPAEVVIIE